MTLSNLSIYWDTSSRLLIPTSLWDSTKDLANQIYEALDLNDLKNFLREYFISL